MFFTTLFKMKVKSKPPLEDSVLKEFRLLQRDANSRTQGEEFTRFYHLLRRAKLKHA